MTSDLALQRASEEMQPAMPIGLAKLAKLAFDGTDLAPLGFQLLERATARPDDAAALMDLSIVLQLMGDPMTAADVQSQALGVRQTYRQSPVVASDTGLRLLALVAPGDFMANTPIEFLLEGSDVTLDLRYVAPGLPLRDPVPDHDLVFVAIGESDQNRAILRHVADLVHSWRRPVLNPPARIAALTRDGTWSLLNSAPGIAMPMPARLRRRALEQLGTGETSIGTILHHEGFPIIARPPDSHAGKGLSKLDDAAAIGPYLQERPEGEFCIAPFVDYRGADGLFRKHRIALIDGEPLACHMAISDHWMVHYLNAGMRESSEKRAEEARFMADFDRDFRPRHETAFRALAERVGLDYFAIDCGETPDGRLLLFEVDVAMIVHAMDPPDLFPYKQPQMRKVREAFRRMLQRRCSHAKL
jgi:glutathione synthase/RimK-type ligase-like ATP-grasp enzyme